MKSVDKVTVLMELISGSKEEQSIRSLEEKSGIPKSTVHRILCALEEKGWVYLNPETERYNVGLRFLFLYQSSGFYKQFTEAASPLIQNLVRETGQTAIISILDGECGHCIFTLEPSSSVRFVANVGMRFPIYAGATGKILLAYAPRDIQEKVLSNPKEKLATNTVTDTAILRKQILEIRRKGYAESAMEMQDHAAGISVPLLNSRGNLIAQFGIAGPVAAFDDKLEIYLEHVKNTAASFIKLLKI